MSTIEIASKAREYKELQIFIKQLQDEAEAIKGEITAEMEARGTDTLQADIFTVKLSEYQSSRVDTKALKETMPELAQRFTQTTTARRFSVA